MTSTNVPPNTQLVIEAGKAHERYWLDLWRFRELFFFLTWRDILVRYKQTVIGVLWSILRPLLTMIVFTIVFGKIAKMPTEGTTPYPLLVFAALLPWQMFSNALQESSNSLIGNADMITKIYFPKMILPVSAIITSVVDFLISLLIFIVLSFFYNAMPGWHILLLPLFIVLALATAIGAGLIISALNVSFRDFRYILPFMVQFGLYVSPVGFSSSAVSPQWRLLYSLNPMVGVIDGFRWCLADNGASFYWPTFIISLLVIMLVLFSGYKLFRHMERTFADKI